MSVRLVQALPHKIRRRWNRAKIQRTGHGIVLLEAIHAPSRAVVHVNVTLSAFKLEQREQILRRSPSSNSAKSLITLLSMDGIFLFISLRFFFIQSPIPRLVSWELGSSLCCCSFLLPLPFSFGVVFPLPFSWARSGDSSFFTGRLCF